MSPSRRIYCTPVVSTEDGFQLSIFGATDEQFQQIVTAVASRDHKQVQALVRQRAFATSVFAIQQLTYLMEYCRKTRKVKLVVVNETSSLAKQEREVLLDLTDFINSNKFCSLQGCGNLGVIECSNCNIAAWCSPQCLQQDYDRDHQYVCKLARHHQMLLFP